LAAGPKAVDVLADEAKCDAAALFRLLRALASVGIFAEVNPREFALTPLADCLRSDVPHSARNWAMLTGDELHWGLWGQLRQSVQAGRSMATDLFGQSYFEYLQAHPRTSEVFDRAMIETSGRHMVAVASAIDGTRFRRLVDVGGGRGLLVSAVLKASPELHALLFDQAQVVAQAQPVLEAADVADRCECVAGDFFEAVPTGADAYVLKSVLHDWSDEECGKILSACRRAMLPHARLLLVEMVMDAPNVQPLANFLDLAMLVLLGGKERTEQEFRELLASSGFRLDRVIPVATPGPSLIEAVLA
jgi:hypothetical protein